MGDADEVVLKCFLSAPFRCLLRFESSVSGTGDSMIFTRLQAFKVSLSKCFALCCVATVFLTHQALQDDLSRVSLLTVLQ